MVPTSALKNKIPKNNQALPRMCEVLMCSLITGETLKETDGFLLGLLCFRGVPTPACLDTLTQSVVQESKPLKTLEQISTGRRQAGLMLDSIGFFSAQKNGPRGRSLKAPREFLIQTRSMETSAFDCCGTFSHQWFA